MSTHTLLPPLRTAFTSAYGHAPTVLAQAPGRVNLIGEHTDYNDGFVLPCAIDFATLVAARPRMGRRVRVLALDQGGAQDEFDLDGPITTNPAQPWANYVRGMVWALQAGGWHLPGAELAITGNVPLGAGLSSSAALEVAVGQAFKQLAGWASLDATHLALLAQRAENDFVGCRCGIMDQIVSARGLAGHALLIDCRSLQATPVALPPELTVLIVNSNVPRGLVDSEYNLRRQQCEAAARHFGVPALRDLDAAGLAEGADGLDATVLRRARHVVTENQRTLDAAQALAAADLPRLATLMAASHASMRDDFAITTPAIDELVAIIGRALAGEGGVRMTGGGFGGCVVAVATQAAARRVVAQVAQEYRSPQGRPAVSYLCQAAAGAGAIALA